MLSGKWLQEARRVLQKEQKGNKTWKRLVRQNEKDIN
jgi:hypothetical protein